jgi:hypothetical protein
MVNLILTKFSRSGTRGGMRAAASRPAQDCRDQAERLRRLAAKAKSPAVRRDYQELASEWDMMADQVEKFLRDKVTPN